MIGVSSLVFDIYGAWVFSSRDNTDAIMSGRRRTSRSATLDGGAVVSDLGYSHGDRTLVVQEKEASEEAVAFARRIVENYSTVAVSTIDGAYLAVPESYEYRDGTLELRLLITEKTSE